MRPHRFPDLPPIWLLGHLILASLLNRAFPIASFEAAWPGRILIALGLALIVWSGLWFWRKKTAIEPGHTPTTLIVEGPYRLNRNPIYTGMVLVLLGFAIASGSVGALLAVIPFPFIITRRFIRWEEGALRSAFGAEAEAYLARTRRW